MGLSLELSALNIVSALLMSPLPRSTVAFLVSLYCHPPKIMGLNHAIRNITTNNSKQRFFRFGIFFSLGFEPLFADFLCNFVR